MVRVRVGVKVRVRVRLLTKSVVPQNRHSRPCRQRNLERILNDPALKPGCKGYQEGLKESAVLAFGRDDASTSPQHFFLSSGGSGRDE